MACSDPQEIENRKLNPPSWENLWLEQIMTYKWITTEQPKYNGWYWITQETIDNNGEIVRSVGDCWYCDEEWGVSNVIAWMYKQPLPPKYNGPTTVLGKTNTRPIYDCPF